MTTVNNAFCWGFLIAIKYFLRRRWCTTSVGYLNIISLKAVTIFIISRKKLSGFVRFSFGSAGQNNCAYHLARRPSGGFGRYLFCAWANHKCTAKMKTYGKKPLFWYQMHQFCFEILQIREIMVVRSMLVLLVILASIHCVQAVGTESWSSEAFREQNHLRLRTRLTSEKQLFVCLFPHLFFFSERSISIPKLIF